jgi:asparagine synthase (glutamine-hydrolysing)
MRTLLATVANQLDEPLADPAAVPTYLLSRFAREHVTVALTGEGADELFAGYNRYRFEARRENVMWVPATMRRGVGSMVGPFAGRRLRKSLTAVGMDPAASFVFLRSIMPAAVRRGLLRADIARDIPVDHLEQRMASHFGGHSRGLNATLRADTMEWLPDDLLMKVDKMSMLASLEARVPFLDHRIVEQVSGLPPRWKHNHGTSKVLLKAIAKDQLPAKIVHRPKHGFTPPIGHWLKGSLKPYLEEQLLDPAALANQWLDAPAVRALVEGYLRGDVQLALPVWALLCLEVWLRGGGARA